MSAWKCSFTFCCDAFRTIPREGFLLLLSLCIAITLARVVHHQSVSIDTFYKIDEIMAGACLASTYNGMLGQLVPKILSNTNP